MNKTINLIGQTVALVPYSKMLETAQNKEMWHKGDMIVILNRSGSVISVSVLTNDGTKCELSNAPLKECECPICFEK